MEEIISLIFHGCKLAKDLEMNVVHIANQPNNLISSCDEIIRVFSNTRERLSALDQTASYRQMIHGQVPPPLPVEVGGGGLQEWLNISQAMDMALRAQAQHHGLPESSRVRGIERREMGLEDLTAGELAGGNAEADVPMDVADSGGRGSLLNRPRRRKDEADRRTIRVPAPRMGNTEVPPEDGYTWRKYGQKEILGSRFPRGYFRCTHQKLYDCPAKKQVQRVDNDPYTFEVTYRGDHTCTLSSTAPSIPPPLAESTTTQSPPRLPPPRTTSLPLSHWLSMNINSSSGGEGTSSSTTTAAYNIDHMQMYREHLGLGSAGPSGTAMAGGSSGAGPSTGRYIDYQGVVDLADVMFNSGSSSNNSMDLIFSSMQDKWEGGDKKN